MKVTAHPGRLIELAMGRAVWTIEDEELRLLGEPGSVVRHDVEQMYVCLDGWDWQNILRLALAASSYRETVDRAGVFESDALRLGRELAELLEGK